MQYKLNNTLKLFYSNNESTANEDSFIDECDIETFIENINSFESEENKKKYIHNYFRYNNYIDHDGISFIPFLDAVNLYITKDINAKNFTQAVVGCLGDDYEECEGSNLMLSFTSTTELEAFKTFLIDKPFLYEAIQNHIDFLIKDMNKKLNRYSLNDKKELKKLKKKLSQGTSFIDYLQNYSTKNTEETLLEIEEFKSTNSEMRNFPNSIIFHFMINHNIKNIKKSRNITTEFLNTISKFIETKQNISKDTELKRKKDSSDDRDEYETKSKKIKQDKVSLLEPNVF